MNFHEYIDDIQDVAVKESVKNISHVEIDGYTDIGRNGYVFFGIHKVFKSRVSIKYYYYGEDTHDEVTVIKTIESKNILHVWDAVEVGEGWAYFITDEMEEGNLDEYLKKYYLSTSLVIDVVRGILNGLSELHKPENALVHRDLKPANILFRGDDRPIIADFGSIKKIQHGSDHVNASGNSMLYKAPENILENRYTYQSDIYQIGIVLYQLMGGTLSYDIKDYMNKVELRKYQKLNDAYEISMFEDGVLNKAITRGKLLDYTSIPCYRCKRIIRIIKNATRVDESKRFRNTADFLLEIHRLGKVADWMQSNDDEYECLHNKMYYRVTKIKGRYVFQKSKDREKWRKVNKIEPNTCLETLFEDVMAVIGS
jgi:serine/threonine protein kinase